MFRDVVYLLRAAPGERRETSLGFERDGEGVRVLTRYSLSSIDVLLGRRGRYGGEGGGGVPMVVVVWQIGPGEGEEGGLVSCFSSYSYSPVHPPSPPPPATRLFATAVATSYCYTAIGVRRHARV